jgi:hypothetical protein
MTSHQDLYFYLSLAAPAVTMFIAAYWQRKLIFWAGAFVSVVLTHLLMLAAEQARAQALFESIASPDDARALIERDVPLVELGPVVALALTLAWGVLAWFVWPRLRGRHSQQA